MFAFVGLCRGSELIPNLLMKDVVVTADAVRVTITKSKTKQGPFNFLLLAHVDPLLDPVTLTRSYLASVKNRTDDQHFFLNWNATSKKYIQNMGVSAKKSVPRMCAKILGYKEEDYTFHAFRRSGASALSHGGKLLSDFWGLFPPKRSFGLFLVGTNFWFRL